MAAGSENPPIETQHHHGGKRTPMHRTPPPPCTNALPPRPKATAPAHQHRNKRRRYHRASTSPNPCAIVTHHCVERPQRPGTTAASPPRPRSHATTKTCSSCRHQAPGPDAHKRPTTTSRAARHHDCLYPSQRQATHPPLMCRYPRNHQRSATREPQGLSTRRLGSPRPPHARSDDIVFHIRTKIKMDSLAPICYIISIPTTGMILPKLYSQTQSKQNFNNAPGIIRKIRKQAINFLLCSTKIMSLIHTTYLYITTSHE